MSRRFKKMIYLLPMLVLAACTETLAVANLVDFNPLEYFDSPVNMREKNYAAADYMISRASGYVKKDDTIRALPLLDIQEPRIPTLFGKQVSEQVGQRLTELGYQVDLHEVWTEVNEAYNPKPLPGVESPDYLLTGSYVRKSSELYITLRLQETATGMERSSFEFSVPRSGNVRKTSTPKPVIYKTSTMPAPSQN